MTTQLPDGRPSWMARMWVMKYWAPFVPSAPKPRDYGWVPVPWAIVCAGSKLEAHDIAKRYSGKDELIVEPRGAYSELNENVAIVMATEGLVDDPSLGFLLVSPSKLSTFDRHSKREQAEREGRHAGGDDA